MEALDFFFFVFNHVIYFLCLEIGTGCPECIYIYIFVPGGKQHGFVIINKLFDKIKTSPVDDFLRYFMFDFQRLIYFALCKAKLKRTYTSVANALYVGHISSFFIKSTICFKIS